MRDLPLNKQQQKEGCTFMIIMLALIIGFIVFYLTCKL